MLTDTERHIAQALRAQLNYLEQVSRARDDAAWQRLKARTDARMQELATSDPDLYAWLQTEIPLTPKGIRLCKQQAMLDRLRGLR